MDTTHDRTFAQVAQRFQAWRVLDSAGATDVDADRIIRALDDNFTTFARGYLAGLKEARENPQTWRDVELG